MYTVGTIIVILSATVTALIVNVLINALVKLLSLNISAYHLNVIPSGITVLCQLVAIE